MIIKAIVRIQESADIRCFVGRGGRAWGSGEVAFYEVSGSSWDNLRGVLKTFDVIGACRLRRDSAERFTEDIGKDYGKLRRLHTAACEHCGMTYQAVHASNAANGHRSTDPICCEVL